MAEPYCLHCELGAIVTLRLNERTVSTHDALAHVLQVAADLIKSCPPQERPNRLTDAIKFFVECSGGKNFSATVTDTSEPPTTRH